MYIYIRFALASLISDIVIFNKRNFWSQIDVLLLMMIVLIKVKIPGINVKLN
jgi:hypothetical protein